MGSEEHVSEVCRKQIERRQRVNTCTRNGTGDTNSTGINYCCSGCYRTTTTTRSSRYRTSRSEFDLLIRDYTTCSGGGGNSNVWTSSWR